MSPPRATVTGPGAGKHIVVDQQETIPPHVVAVPRLGNVLFYHATAATVAEISVNDGAQRIAIQLATPGCGFGCGASGRGMLLTPGAEEARLIAGQLLALADEHEATAATQAAAAIAKAAGR